MNLIIITMLSFAKGHENARLFISHGGLMGIQESVYHGVPLLGLPFGNDQRGYLSLYVPFKQLPIN